MTAPLYAEVVFQRLRASMDLTWIAGEGASRRVIPLIPGSKSRLAGFLNLIDPPSIQVLGAREMDFLRSLDATVCSSLIKRVLSAPLGAVLLCGRNPQGIELFRRAAQDANVPIWHTTAPASTALEELRLFSRQTWQSSTVLHGVLLEIFELGVLLTGKSGSGKSELALDLISRGHRLIADDAPEVFCPSPEVLEGTCPESLRDFLEVRGLGILNIKRMFGERAIGTRKQVHLLVGLTCLEPENPSAETRLRGSRGQRNILDVMIPEIRLPICAGRNPAVLVECAVRDHILRLRGYHADRDLEGRLQADLTGNNNYANDHC